MERDELYNGISMDDVWGTSTEPTSTEFKRLTNGMMVARGLPYEEGSPEALEIQNNSDDTPLPQICPAFGDKLPYKSVTVVCEEKDVEAVQYWLSYVHGGNNISDIRKLEDGKIALRSDYTCW